MENNFLKINKQCIQQLVNVNSALPSVETKGDSTMIMYKIRLIIDAVLQQIQKDNNSEIMENPLADNIIISEKEDKEKANKEKKEG